MKPTSSVALVSLGSRALAMLRPASDDPVLPAKGHAQLLEPRHFPDLNPIRLRTRYGPFTVPGVEDPDTMGMQSFTGLLDFPCTGCIVTYIAADLEFEDGSLANAHTGMWLHHTLLASVGKQDETCDEGLGAARVWASGNERTPMDFTNNGVDMPNGTRKAGLHIGQDTIGHATELMNESRDARDAYFVLVVEYLHSSTPGFRPATPIYLDVVGLCTYSEVPVPEGAKAFNRSVEWKIGYPGEVLSIFGHLHDGGTRQETGLNGEVVCVHIARYGESEGFITHLGMFNGSAETDDEGHSEEDNHHQGGGGHDHSTSDHIAHISSISYCEDLGGASPPVMYAP